MGDRRVCDYCGKRCFAGVHEARKAHAGAHYRIRVYWCNDGQTFHTTNGDKRSGRDRDDYRGEERRRRPR